MAKGITALDLTPQQAETFARGLYHLSAVDGADAAELALVESFIAQTGFGGTLDDLAAGTFDPVAAAKVLDTEALRRAFLRAAVAILRADDDISDEEFDALRAVAVAFEQKPALVALLSESPGAIL